MLESVLILPTFILITTAVLAFTYEEFLIHFIEHLLHEARICENTYGPDDEHKRHRSLRRENHRKTPEGSKKNQECLWDAEKKANNQSLIGPIHFKRHSDGTLEALIFWKGKHFWKSIVLESTEKPIEEVRSPFTQNKEGLL